MNFFHHYCHVSDFYALNDLCKKILIFHFEYSSAIDEKHANSEFEMKMYFIIMDCSITLLNIVTQRIQRLVYRK
jgi:hypothetical protein